MKLPEDLEPDLLVDRLRGAQLVTKHRFPLSERKLREWPMRWVYINGYACCTVAELFAHADRVVREARHEPSRDLASARRAKRLKHRPAGDAAPAA